MKFLGRKLGTPSKRLGNKLSEVGKQFGGKIRHSHPGHQGHYVDETRSDLERHHGGDKSHNYEHRHETRSMGHDIHKHPPLTGAPFMTHGADHRFKHDRKKNH
jgi:hypothetical protein